MGITVLVVTHEHELVHRFHQRVVTLRNGRIISDVPADKEAMPWPPPRTILRLDVAAFDAERCVRCQKGGGAGMRTLYLLFSYPARCAQFGQALGHDHCLHRFFECCMTLNIFASLAEVNVDSMVTYLGSQNETVVYLDPECDDATASQVGEKLSAMPGVSGVQYVSKQDVLNTYRGYMQDYSSLWDEFEDRQPL